MCMMIVKPAGKSVPEDHILNSWSHNEDGAGFACARNGKITLEKGFRSVGKFLEAYHQTVTDDVPAILHFRFATHGRVDTQNCHPFAVTNDVVMAHNGIIPNIKTEAGESDTAAFVRTVVRPDLQMSPSIIHQQAWHEKLCKMIGNSKLGFLTSDGRTLVDGENLGVWNDGIWYSNSGYSYDANDYAYAHNDGWWSHGKSGGGVKTLRKESRRIRVDDWERGTGEYQYAPPTPEELGMMDTKVLHPDWLECDICGQHIKDYFTMDRESGVMACDKCCVID